MSLTMKNIYIPIILQTQIEKVQRQNERLLCEVDDLKRSMTALRDILKTLVAMPHSRSHLISRSPTPAYPRSRAASHNELSLQDVVTRM